MSGGVGGGSGLYANPTAQSTPVGVSKRPAAHSMLTTPNNSILSLNNDENKPSNSHQQQSTPTKATSGAKFSPARHYSSRLSDAPRTPTPFKKALADVFNRGEPISNTVSADTLFGVPAECFLIDIEL